RELVELIESPLGRAPVELLLPVRDELFEVREVRSVVPIRAGDLSREARACQPLLEIREYAVSDVDLEWDDCVRSPRRRWTWLRQSTRRDRARNEHGRERDFQALPEL